MTFKGPKKAKTWSANQRKFQQWLALPSNEREPQTQSLLAEELKVNHVTLSKWKRLTLVSEDGEPVETFQEAVTQIARSYLGEDLPEVYAALRDKAKEGSYQHIRLALELTGEYVERTQQELMGEGGGPVIFLPKVTDGSTDPD